MKQNDDKILNILYTANLSELQFQAAKKWQNKSKTLQIRF